MEQEKKGSKKRKRESRNKSKNCKDNEQPEKEGTMKQKNQRREKGGEKGEIPKPEKQPKTNEPSAPSAGDIQKAREESVDQKCGICLQKVLNTFIFLTELVYLGHWTCHHWKLLSCILVWQCVDVCQR